MPQTPEPEVLDGRTQSILTAIVHCFIQNAEPIGSRTISKRFDFGLSPATIRNVMSDLEDLGFLEQPHTSAGRVPTDKGYRFYVNHLSALDVLSSEDSARISQRYKLYRGEVDEVMAETSRLLSDVTQYAGWSFAPSRPRFSNASSLSKYATSRSWRFSSWNLG